MYQNGELQDDDIYADLTDIVSGVKPGRENNDEFIYFNSVGLSYVDIALAYEIYRRCVSQNLGLYLDYCDKSVFERDLIFDGEKFIQR